MKRTKPVVYIPPDEHPAKGCPLCRSAPYCPECYGHHAPLVESVCVPAGPRPIRVIALDAAGLQAGDPIDVFPAGVNGREDKDAALAFARKNPGRRAAIEKRGTWFAPDRWERFEVVGPFDRQGNPIHVRDVGLERRAAYLKRCAEDAQRREDERARAAEAGRAAKAASQGEPVARPGGQKRPRRR